MKQKHFIPMEMISMTNFFYNYGLFLAEALTITIAILLTAAGIAAIAGKGKKQAKEKIEVCKLNEKYANIKKSLQEEILSKKELKEEASKEKEQEKRKKQLQNNEDAPPQKRIYVLNFQGDLKASAVENLREEVTALLTILTPQDEVVVKIDSPGGMIHTYGLAASQLKRIRDRNIRLIAAVDKVAASGGYMMACVAHKIIAAPFAILGSIGVIAQIPNFNRLLKKHNVDFEQFMAGEYKRTVTLFGENTSKGRKKFQEELDEAHTLFKTFVAQNRPIVNINAIATGEHWFGTRAREMRLVDELITSDDYLLQNSEKTDIYAINYSVKKNLWEKFSFSASKAWGRIAGHY
jgi:serine protease SohB